MTEDEAREALKALTAEGGAIIGERGNDYGDPRFNLWLYGRLNRVVVEGIIERERRGMEPLPPGAEGAVSAIVLKLSRVLTGPEIKRDTLLDIIGYTCTLAWAWMLRGGKR